MDLTEILAYALVACSLLFNERKQIVVAGVCCGLAVLAKETAMPYAIAILLGSATPFRRSWVRFALLALGPEILWQCVLQLRFGSNGITAALEPRKAGHGMMPLRRLLWASTNSNWVLQIMLD